MRSSNLAVIAAEILLMLVFPWCAVHWIPNQAGMLACMVLFFAVNPAAAVCIGWYSGKDFSRRWYLPILLSLLFVMGAWLFIQAGERIFLLYGAGYLFLSIVSAALAHWKKSRREKSGSYEKTGKGRKRYG